MTLHRLTSVTMGVPNVAETIAYYDPRRGTPRSLWIATPVIRG